MDIERRYATKSLCSENRGLKPPRRRRVMAVVGDGRARLQSVLATREKPSLACRGCDPTASLRFILVPSKSDPEERAHALTENPAGKEDREGEEDHGPDTEGARDKAAIAEKLEQLVDSFRDREVGLLLRKDERIADFKHGEREGQERAGDQVGGDQREGDAPKG